MSAVIRTWKRPLSPAELLAITSCLCLATTKPAKGQFCEYWVVAEECSVQSTGVYWPAFFDKTYQIHIPEGFGDHNGFAIYTPKDVYWKPATKETP